ncbi:MAG: hypothetical protein M3292_09960 [Actinomycetota bacterium]|nr:hypothetical protein [Actinomycetota bacterium]
MSQPGAQIVSAARTLRALVGAALLLCLISVLVNVAFRAAGSNPDQYSRHFFDVDSEQNLPTWFSVIELALAASLAFVIAVKPRSEHAVRHRRRWLLLAAILALMSLDELASVHENTSSYVREVIPVGDAIPYAWVIPALVLVACVGIVYIRFVLTLAPRVRRLLLLAAFIYVAAAAGLDLVDGAVNGDTTRPLAAAKIAVTTSQEAGEMLGVAVAIYGLLLMADPDPARAGRERVTAGSALALASGGVPERSFRASGDRAFEVRRR